MSGFRSETIMESMEDEGSPEAEAQRYRSRKGPQRPLIKNEGSPIDGTPAPFSDMQFSSDMPDIDTDARGRAQGYVRAWQAGHG